VIKINQNDYGPSATLSFRVTDRIITSLAGYNIWLLVWGSDVLQPIVNGACVFDSGMTCHYVPAKTDFTTSGNYLCELEFDGVGDRLSTIPMPLQVSPSPTHSP